MKHTDIVAGKKYTSTMHKNCKWIGIEFAGGRKGLVLADSFLVCGDSRGQIDNLSDVIEADENWQPIADFTWKQLLDNAPAGEYRCVRNGRTLGNVTLRVTSTQRAVFLNNSLLGCGWDVPENVFTLMKMED
jgi:hypothetical protein